MSKTQQLYPAISDYRIRVSVKIFRTSANSGGRVRIGIGGLLDNADFNNQLSTDIRMLDIPSNAWSTHEFYLSGSILSGTVPASFIKWAEPPLNGDIYISDLIIQESALGPNAPQNSQTASYTLRITDQGKHVYITTGGVTVPPNADVPFPVETIVSIVNASGSAQTISQGSGVTLRLSGTATTGNRTLAAYGIATLLKVNTNEWHVTGNVT